jgi:hypothetical protein
MSIATASDLETAAARPLLMPLVSAAACAHRGAYPLTMWNTAGRSAGRGLISI